MDLGCDEVLLDLNDNLEKLEKIKAGPDDTIVRDERVVRVWVTKKRTNGQQNLGDGEGRRPLRPVDVWVWGFGANG